MVGATQMGVGQSRPAASSRAASTLPQPFAGAGSHRGFSLIEMMVVVTISGVLLAFAVPAFNNFIKTERLRSAASGLFEALTIARSEAIKRGAAVVVAPAAGGWIDGWSVKFGTTTLKTFEPERDVTYRQATGTGQVSYGLSGRVGGDRELVLYVDGNAAIPARCVTIDASGRVSVRVDKDGDQSNGC